MSPEEQNTRWLIDVAQATVDAIVAIEPPEDWKDSAGSYLFKFREEHGLRENDLFAAWACDAISRVTVEGYRIILHSYQSRTS